MARPVRPGLSGIAVLFAGLGAWMVYASVRDVDPVYGLGSLLRGDEPASRSPGGTKNRTGGSGTTIGYGTVGKVIPQSETTVVGGIRVSKTIAPAITKLLGDARAAGFTAISGGGWRSTIQQKALRAIHGYTSDDQPSGSGGRMPVAVPGTSRHEQGVAVDFTNHGKSLTRADPFFGWLDSNAATYGLRNLPSEPWHWSVDGH